MLMMKRMKFAAAIAGALILSSLAGCRKNEPPMRDLKLPELTSAITLRSTATLQLQSGNGHYTITSQDSQIATAEFADAGTFGAIEVTTHSLGKTTIDVVDDLTGQRASLAVGVVPRYFVFGQREMYGPTVAIDDAQQKAEIEKQLAENPMLGPEQYFALVIDQESTLLIYNSWQDYCDDKPGARGTYTVELGNPARITLNYDVKGESKTIRIETIDNSLSQLLEYTFPNPAASVMDMKIVAQTRYSPPYRPMLWEERTADFIGQYPRVISCGIYHRVSIDVPVYSPIMKNVAS